MTKECSFPQAQGRLLSDYIVSLVKKNIVAGIWLPGQELPEMSEVIDGNRLNELSIKRAYSELEALGVINTPENARACVSSEVGLKERLMELEFLDYLELLTKVGRRLELNENNLAEKIKKT